MPDPHISDMRQIWVNDVSASSGISSPEQVVNSIPKQSFRRSYVKMSLIFTFSLFFWFSNDFIRRPDFTHISA